MLIRLVTQDARGGDFELAPDDFPVIFGRSLHADRVVPDPLVSRQHCQLSLQDEQVMLTDLDSTNGTLVNNDAISDPTQLEDGDTILLGSILYTVEYARELETTAVRDRASKLELSNA